jgi:UDP-N-acetylglucosamine acyltransferase
VSGACLHPTAVIDSSAVIAADTIVGPYCVIGADVEIGSKCHIGPHVVIEGPTRIGDENRVFQFASLGAPPQDTKYAGEPTPLIVGHRNTIREAATLHRGTVDGSGETRIGDDNLLMAYSHVAHDCRLGDSVIMANGATLGGHVEIEDFAIIGGLAAVHQYCRVGQSSMIGGGAMAVQDVPPFCIAVGDRARLAGLNVVGLRRRGFDRDRIAAIKSAYRLLFQSKLPRAEALARIRSESSISEDVARMLEFIENSSRGVCR